MPLPPSEAGKGPGRRREDMAKVEANWPTNWDARDQERKSRGFIQEIGKPETRVEIVSSDEGKPTP